MLIALEGCDGTGKSSLAQSIVDQIKKQFPDDEVHLLHSGPLDTDPYTAYLAPLKDYTPGSGVHYVLDRWHVGEMVYGPLYREKSQINHATWVWLELWFASRGMTLVHVTQTLDIIRQRLEERGEDFLQPEHVDHVRQEFARVSRGCLTLGMTVYPDGDTSREVASIIAHASLDEESAIGLPKSYVGSPYSKYLLVGDSRGGQPPYEYDGAFRPVNGNSGEYLWSALNEASDWDLYYLSSGAGDDVNWHAISAINSDPEEEPDLEAALLRTWFTSTLGRKAKERVAPILARTASPVSHVPHPQAIRRFHNSKKTAYAELILSTFRTGEDNSSWPK